MDNEILGKIIFRKLNENDKNIFISLRITFLIECFNINETEKNIIQNELEQYFYKHINKNDFIGIIGEYNGEIVSVAYLIINEKPANLNMINGKGGTLLNVYTFPEYRRKGISKKLIQKILEEAKTYELKFIDLMATEDGYNLYKKLGFNDSKDKSMNIKL